MGNQASVDETVYQMGSHGPEHFFTLSQQQIASLVRVGLDLDLVLNPYQMERLNEDSDSKKGPEVAPSVHVNNSSHIDAKGLLFTPASVEEQLDGWSFRLRIRYASSVPFALTIYFLAQETVGADGCPSLVPVSPAPSIASPIRVMLSPSPDAYHDLLIPSDFSERVPLVSALIAAAAAASSSGNTPPSVASVLSPFPHATAAHIAEMQNLREKICSPTFHHLVIQAETAVPVSQPDIRPDTASTPLAETVGYGSTGASNSDLSHAASNVDGQGGDGAYHSPNGTRAPNGAKGYTSVEWSFIKLRHTMARVPISQSEGQMQVVSLGVDSVKRALVAGKGIFEGLEVYGWPDVISGQESSANDDVVVSMESGENGSPDCVVCMCTPSELVILPCRHLCLCVECAKTLNGRAESNLQIKCPMCRERVGGYVDIRS